MSPRNQATEVTGTAGEWQPSSWRSLEAQQMAVWEDGAHADRVLQKLSTLPPLVSAAEIESLKSQLAAAGRGERFLIQGGDCAERFIDCDASRLESQLKLMLQMGMIAEHSTGKPSVCICRIAGQYGKPRSKPTEVLEGLGEVMSFKGDNINGIDPTDRKWDPERLLQGYFHSTATLNYLRTYSKSADPKELAGIKIASLKDSPDFGVMKRSTQEISAKYAAEAPTEFFTAHEAMQLDLEEALTRKVGEKHYNQGAHLVWIGDRTRQINGAHVEYFRGIANPIGVKIGPTMKADELKELVQVLNPQKEEGRLMIITRYGAGKVEEMLPAHIEAVKATGVPVVWQCDAVHGNGIVAKSNKYKTRHMDDIVNEILQCIEVHKRCGSVLGGIHVEVTGQESVTEVLGGAIGLTEEMLTKNYETNCDPRLNYAQGIEMVFKFADELNSGTDVVEA